MQSTPLSGSNWKSREDGQSEKLLAQIKATDGKQIAVKLIDLTDLEHHARIARKYPIFVIQFTSEDDPWIMVRPYHIEKVAKYLEYNI